MLLHGRGFLELLDVLAVLMDYPARAIAVEPDKRSLIDGCRRRLLTLAPRRTVAP